MQQREDQICHSLTPLLCKAPQSLQERPRNSHGQGGLVRMGLVGHPRIMSRCKQPCKFFLTFSCKFPVDRQNQTRITAHENIMSEAKRDENPEGETPGVPEN